MYGTLLNDEVLNIVLGHVPVQTPARLKAYTRVKVVGEHYPVIRPHEDGDVAGALLVNLSASDLRCLDDYEGPQYIRENVQVELPNGEFEQCMTYVFKTEYHSALSNEPWSNEEFREKHLEGFLSVIAGED